MLRLVHGAVSFLLTADVEAATEYQLLRDAPGLNSRVLKVAHHGSKSSTTPAFLARVDPTVAVVSVGEDNPFGHPNPEIVQRLEAATAPNGIYRTDQDGTIEFISDGQRLWVRTER